MNNPYDGILQQPVVDFSRVRDGRRSALFYYDVDLSTARSVAAGTHLILPVAGDSFFVDKNPVKVGPATIHFQDTTQGIAPAPVYCEPGFIANVPFTQLLVENDAQPGKIFRFHYGVDIDFQPGTSSTVAATIGNTVTTSLDPIPRALAGKTYTGVIVQSASAGRFSQVQLHNPVGSGKTLIVWGFDGISALASDMQLTLSNGFQLAGVGSPPVNKLFAGAASVAALRADTNVGTPAGLGSGFYNLAAAVRTRFLFRSPFILVPNNGLVFWQFTANSLLEINYDYEEQ